jgi:hypothetical protein
MYANSLMLGGCLYVVGELCHIPRVERYDLASNTWTAVADMLEGRNELGAATIWGAAEEQDPHRQGYQLATSRELKSHVHIRNNLLANCPT